MENISSRVQYEYDAFISYRHVPRDMDIARRLHGALEAYHTPKYLVKRGVPARLRRIFRDKEELPTSSDLGQDIEDALKHSKYLIVICSPEALQSLWVQKEVELFSAYHGFERILALLVEGEPQDAFPPGLIRRLTDEHGNVTKVIEPLAADIRPKCKETALQLLKKEKLRLIAGILGCMFDELRQREQERRVQRIVTVSVSAGAFLLALTAFTLWQLQLVNEAKTVAVQNEQMALDAKTQAQDAEAKAKQSEQDALEQQSNLYATLARQATDSGDRLLGMSLAMEALPKDLKNPEKPFTQEAKDALYYAAALQGQQLFTVLYPGEEVSSQNADNQLCGFLDGCNTIYTSNGETVWFFDGGSGRLQHSWQASANYNILAVSPNGRQAIIANCPDFKNIDVQVWDIYENTMIKQAKCVVNDSELAQEVIASFGLRGFTRADFNADGTQFYIAFNTEISFETYKSVIDVCSAADGSLLWEYPLDDSVQYISFVQGSKILAGYYGSIRIISASGKTEYTAADSAVDTATIQPCIGFIATDGRYLTYVDENSELHRIDMTTGIDTVSKVSMYCQLSSDGKLVGYWATDSEFDLYDLNTGVRLARIIDDISNFGYDFTLSPDGGFVYFNDSNILENYKEHFYRRLRPKGLLTGCFAISQDCGRMVSMNHDSQGEVYILSCDDGRTGDLMTFWNDNTGDTSCTVSDGNVILQSSGDPNKETKIVSWDCAKNVSTYVEVEADAECTIAGPKEYTVRVGTRFNIYDRLTGQFLKALDIPVDRADNVSDIIISSNRKYIALNGSDRLEVLDYATEAVIFTFDETVNNYSMTFDTHCMGFFPGNQYIWVVGDSKQGNGLHILDMKGDLVSFAPIHEKLLEWDEMKYGVMNVSGTRIIICTNKLVTFWSIDEGMRLRQICELPGVFSCSSDQYFCMVQAGTAYVYAWETGNLVSKINCGQDIVETCMMDGGRLLVASDHVVSLWNAQTGKVIAPLYRNELMTIEGLGLVNGGMEMAVVCATSRRACVRILPIHTSFDDVYASALAQLHGRTFDISQDLNHIS